MAVYDNGLFLQDTSLFPLWDGGLFRTDFSNTFRYDCGYWSESFRVSGIDVSAAALIFGLVSGLGSAPSLGEPFQSIQNRIGACVRELQILSAGVPVPFDPNVLALSLVTQVILAARLALGFISDGEISHTLELQIAALQLSSRLLQMTIAGLN